MNSLMRKLRTREKKISEKKHFYLHSIPFSLFFSSLLFLFFFFRMLAAGNKIQEHTINGESQGHRLRDPGLRLRSRGHAEQRISRKMVLQRQRSGLPMDIR